MNAANLTQAHALYLATREGGWSAEEKAAAEATYRGYAVTIARGLPFLHHLARVAPSYYNTAVPVTHIVCDEKTVRGKLRRLAGDTVCRPRSRISGALSDVRADEEGATCYVCLAIAEAHSSVEQQAS